MTNNSDNEAYTLDAIRNRKDEVLTAIRKDKDKIGARWSALFAPPEANSKGQRIMNIINNGFAIYDGTMMGLKLMKRCRSFFSRSRK